MEISFANSKLQRRCESLAQLQRVHGPAAARRLTARLADLRAVASLEEMRRLPGSCHELRGNRDGHLGLDLPDGKRLIFEPASNPTPTKPDGGLDWAAVEAVRVLEIVDYH